MKKLIAILTLIATLFCIVACGKSNDTKEPAETDNKVETVETQEETAETTIPAEPEEISYWDIGNYVDEFGDPVGENFLYGIFSGTYSDTYTNNGYLEVKASYDFEYKFISLDLYENGTQKATYYDGSEMRLLYKIGDKKYETDKVSGLAPNGSIDIDVLNRDYSTNGTITSSLMNGKDITCILYIDNSKYNFTLYADGYSEALSELINLG